jgi:bifunctional DNA primase/polymerase-like protein/primase-like protein
MAKRFPDNMLAAALLYGEVFAWTVFPAPPGTKKSYLSSKYSGGRRWGASNDPAKLERHFGKVFTKANIGIPTGAENGFWVLEADTPKGHAVDGIAELRKLERKYGRLPKTLMAVSPSGSLHYYFKWPKGKLVICNSASKIAPGLDVRGEGGMVLAPPSLKDGVGQYRFLNWGTPGAFAPKWLLELVVRKPAIPTKTSNKESERPIRLLTGGGADVDLITRALDVVARTCGACRRWPYQLWFEIGCALHAELGDVGFELFKTFSASSPTYNAHSVAKKWKECAKIGTYSIGTILYFANMADPTWRAAYEAERMAETYSFFGKLRKRRP